MTSLEFPDSRLDGVRQFQKVVPRSLRLLLVAQAVQQGRGAFWVLLHHVNGKVVEVRSLPGREDRPPKAHRRASSRGRPNQ